MIRKHLENIFGKLSIYYNPYSYGIHYYWHWVATLSLLITIAYWISAFVSGYLIAFLFYLLIPFAFYVSTTIDFSDLDEHRFESVQFWFILYSTILLPGFLAVMVITHLLIAMCVIITYPFFKTTEFHSKMMNKNKIKRESTFTKVDCKNPECESPQNKILTYRDVAPSCPSCKQVINES
jgi:hypothetical protein